MIVYDLCCSPHAHRFEGWFGSSDDFAAQQARGLVTCPICGSSTRGEDVAEVIYKTTGARGIAHAECYLADRCCYTLA